MERTPLWLYFLLLFAVGALYPAAFRIAQSIVTRELCLHYAQTQTQTQTPG